MGHAGHMHIPHKKSELDSLWNWASKLDLGYMRPFGSSPFPSSLGSIPQSHHLNPQMPIYASMTYSPSLSLLSHPCHHPIPLLSYCWPFFSHPLEPSQLQQLSHAMVLPPLSPSESLTWAVSWSHVWGVTHIVHDHLWGNLLQVSVMVHLGKGSEGCVCWQTWTEVVEAVWPETLSSRTNWLVAALHTIVHLMKKKSRYVLGCYIWHGLSRSLTSHLTCVPGCHP